MERQREEVALASAERRYMMPKWLLSRAELTFSSTSTHAWYRLLSAAEPTPPREQPGVNGPRGTVDQLAQPWTLPFFVFEFNSYQNIS